MGPQLMRKSPGGQTSRRSGIQLASGGTVTLLVAKLVLTPLLISAVTLAGRRWGPGVSGWLAGLPLTSGPVSVFLAVEQGPQFAMRAALGTLAGLAAVAAFALSYPALAPPLRSALPTRAR